MKPDSLFKCIKNFSGKSQANRPIRLEEGKEYCRTIVDLASMGHSSKKETYFLCLWDQPSRSQIELSPEEFAKLQGEYLQESRRLV